MVQMWVIRIKRPGVGDFAAAMTPGDCQIEGARRMQTLNIGGFCATVAVLTPGWCCAICAEATPIIDAVARKPQ